MNRLRQIAACMYIFMLISSCTQDFEDINSDPNSPQHISPEFLLTNVIVESAQLNAYQQGFRLANYLSQYAASVEFERIDRYEMGSNSAYWDALYHLLTDIESIKTIQGTNDAYSAVSEIMACHLCSQLTDMWGDVPYTQSIQARQGNFTPEYDRQEFIYTDPNEGILARLDRSIKLLEKTTDLIAGDPMYGGDLKKWIRFAQSLRLRYILRISRRINDFSDFQKIVDSGIFISSNEDNAVIPYTTSAPNQFPISFSSEGLYREHRMTHTMDSILHILNDPRMEIYYKPTQKSVQSGNLQYKGLTNGLNRETISAMNIDLEDISLFGAIFRDQTDGVDAQIMQYAEGMFAIAEAIERGYINGSLDYYYREGIKASMNYYNTEFSEVYYRQENVQLNGQNNLEKILTQKWIALFNVGHEAWFNVRRTGIPHLKPGPNNLNNDQYPSRYLYPESEQATNLKNYQIAADQIGGDNINSKCWWQQ